jgi:hypothetical protein
MQFDKSRYRPGMELTQDAGEVIFTKDDATALITKGASAQEIVDDVCIRAGLPTTAELKEAGRCLDAMAGKIREYKSQKFWENYWRYQAYL